MYRYFFPRLGLRSCKTLSVSVNSFGRMWFMEAMCWPNLVYTPPCREQTCSSRCADRRLTSLRTASYSSEPLSRFRSLDWFE